MPDHDSPPLSLVIADDHSVVRRGLRAFVEMARDIRLLASASSGREAVRAVRSHAPDVLLLDLLMPDQDATETIRAIKAVSPNTQIVVLTSHEGNEHLSEVLAAGALSYVLKDIAPNELIHVLRQARSGDAFITPRVAKRMLENDPSSRAGSGLTARELDVLMAIAKGLSNKQIAEKLDITERTVKSHVSSILSKLYLSDRTQAAIYAWREGVIDDRGS